MVILHKVDLINKNHSGLLQSKKILQDIKEVKCIEFDHTDVVRHPLVSKIIQAYQQKTDDKVDVFVKNKNWKKKYPILINT